MNGSPVRTPPITSTQGGSGHMDIRGTNLPFSSEKSGTRHTLKVFLASRNGKPFHAVAVISSRLKIRGNWKDEGS